jgi:hypothetical protein
MKVLRREATQEYFPLLKREGRRLCEYVHDRLNGGEIDIVSCGAVVATNKIFSRLTVVKDILNVFPKEVPPHQPFATAQVAVQMVMYRAENFLNGRTLHCHDSELALRLSDSYAETIDVGRARNTARF